MNSSRFRSAETRIGDACNQMRRGKNIDIPRDPTTALVAINSNLDCKRDPEALRLRRKILEGMLQKLMESEDAMDTDAELKQLTDGRDDPMNVIYYVFERGLRAAFDEAMETLPEFRNDVQMYDISYAGYQRQTHYSCIREELIGTSCYGTSILLSLYEMLPKLFEKKYERKPTMQELEELMRTALTPMISELTRLSAMAAVSIEQRCGLYERSFLDPNGKTAKRKLLHEDSFELRNCEGRDVVDLALNTAQRVQGYIVLNQSHARMEYHGCLAGQSTVHVPDKNGKSVPKNAFGVVQKMMANFVRTHAYPHMIR
jgi:hypothetical protein